MDEILDKIHGGWFGKCLGGAAGASLEGVKNIGAFTHYKDVFDDSIPNDDLDIQLLWLEELEEKGVALTAEYMAQKWDKQCWYPFSEYGQFLYNYERGIMPPLSGSYDNEFFLNGMGCPIRSEIWAFAFAKRPEIAKHFAMLDATLDHGDLSVQAECYMAVAESLAFMQDDIVELLLNSLDFIEKENKFYDMVQFVVTSYKKGDDLQKLKNTVIRKYGHLDFTNSVQNMAFVIMALLFGEKDMEKTVNIALNLGYDTDCTCGNAAAILGTVLGYSKIDSGLKTLISPKFVCGIDVKRKSDKIEDLAKDTYNLYIKLQDEAPKNVDVFINYNDAPYINLGGKAVYNVVGYKKISDVSITAINGNLSAEYSDKTGEITMCADKNELFEKNIFELSFLEENKRQKLTFGVAGLPTYKCKGVFFEQASYPYNKNHPLCHGEGCTLPSVENMVNNKAELSVEYTDESALLKGIKDEDFILNCKNSFLPYEDEIGYDGQMCFYAQCTVVSPIKQKVWLVPQNTDGFKIWLDDKEVIAKDEMRCFTPNNNCEIVELLEGETLLTIKLLRRSDYMKFALNFNEYNGEHYHKTRRLTNLRYK